MANNDTIIRGAKAIAHELGCSRGTLTKLVKDGKFPAQHGFSGGRTSPLVVERKALDDFKRGQKG